MLSVGIALCSSQGAYCYVSDESPWWIVSFRSMRRRLCAARLDAIRWPCLACLVGPARQVGPGSFAVDCRFPKAERQFGPAKVVHPMLGTCNAPKLVYSWHDAQLDNVGHRAMPSDWPISASQGQCFFLSFALSGG